MHILTVGYFRNRSSRDCDKLLFPSHNSDLSRIDDEFHIGSSLYVLNRAAVVNNLIAVICKCAGWNQKAQYYCEKSFHQIPHNVAPSLYMAEAADLQENSGRVPQVPRIWAPGKAQRTNNHPLTRKINIYRGTNSSAWITNSGYAPAPSSRTSIPCQCPSSSTR